jgi:hypothetical protein
VPGASSACTCANGAMGAQQCQADGRSFGVCLCIGTASSTSSGAGGAGGGSASGGGGAGGSVGIGDAFWAREFGSTSGARALSVATDAAGATVVGGVFFGSIALGATNATCPGTNESCGFVAKIAPNGAVVWGAAFVGADDQSNVDQAMIAIGPNGEVWVAGGFTGAIDFGDSPVGASGHRSLYVVKFDAAGKLARGLHYDVGATPAIASANGAVVQKSGNLVLQGYVDGGIDFGRGAVGPGMFLTEIAPSGVASWSVAFAGTVEDSGSGLPGPSTLARTSSGELRLVARAESAANLGCDALPDDTSFVAGLDATATTCRFAKPYAGTKLTAIATDASDDSTSVSGNLASGAMLTIGPDMLTGQGTSDILVFHLDATGTEVWGKNFGTSGATDVGVGVAVEPTSGDIAITGAIDGAIDFGGGAVAGDGSAFAAIFKRDSTLRWAGRFGASSGAIGAATSFASKHDLVVVGSFSGTMSFPSKVIQANGDFSGFAAALDVP